MAQPERPTPPAATPQDAADPPAVATHYSLSEAPIEALADLAPTLKEAELRIYLELMRQEIHSGAAVTASSRQIATWCKIARSKAIPAIDSLTKRGLLTTRQGSANRTAIYQVNALQTVRIVQTGGPFRGPLEPETWSPKGTTQVPLRDGSGPLRGPGPADSKALAPAATALDNFRLQNPTLDRVLKCKVSDFDKTTVEFFRRALHSYMAKFGRDEANRRYADTGAVPHPPDNDVVARFLAVSEPHRLMPLIESLSYEAERDDTLQPHSYPWFVYVGLSRLAGIHFSATRQAEQQFRLHKRGQRTAPPAPAAEQTGLDFAQDLQRQAIAGVKKLR